MKPPSINFLVYLWAFLGTKKKDKKPLMPRRNSSSIMRNSMRTKME
jgi:hypothetical protein